MIAVAKGLLSGLETSVTSTTKKDGNTPPFADTFQQVSANRTDQTSKALTQRMAKTDRASSGGKKISGSSNDETAKQDVGGAAVGAASVAKVDANGLSQTVAGVVTEETSVADEKPTPTAAEKSTGVADVVEQRADTSDEPSSRAVVSQPSVSSNVARLNSGDLATPEGKFNQAQFSQTVANSALAGKTTDGQTQQVGFASSDVVAMPKNVAMNSNPASVAVGSSTSSFQPVSQEVSEQVSSLSNDAVRRVNVSFGTQQTVAQADQKPAAVIPVDASITPSAEAQGVVTSATSSSQGSVQISTQLPRASLVPKDVVASAPVPSARANASPVNMQSAKAISSATATKTIADSSGADAFNAGEVISGVGLSTVSLPGPAGNSVSVQPVPQAVTATIGPNEITNNPGPVPAPATTTGSVEPNQIVSIARPAPVTAPTTSSLIQLSSGTKTTDLGKATVEVAGKHTEGKRTSPSETVVAGSDVITSPVAVPTQTPEANAPVPNAVASSVDVSAYRATSSIANVSSALSSHGLDSDVGASPVALISQGAKGIATLGNIGQYVTQIATNSVSGIKGPKTPGQGSATPVGGQGLVSEAEASPEVSDIVPSVNDIKGPVDVGMSLTGNEAVVVTAKSLVKSGQQHGVISGTVPLGKERKGATAENTAVGAASVLAVSGHVAALAGSSAVASSSATPAASEYQQVATGGLQSTPVPNGDIAGASLTAQFQAIAATGPASPVVAHAAPTSASADSSTLAATASSQMNIQGLDHGFSPLAHTTLSATPTVLEVGVPGGTQGWLKIRAEIGEGGVVQASMSASTHAGQDALRRDLPAISAFLESEHIPVSLQVTHGASASLTDGSGLSKDGGFDLGSSLGQSMNQNANSSAGSGAGETAAGVLAGGSGSGQNGGQQQDTTGRATDAGSGPIPARAAPVSADSDWTAPAGYGGGSTGSGGSWLNVIA